MVSVKPAARRMPFNFYTPHFRNCFLIAILFVLGLGLSAAEPERRSSIQQISSFEKIESLDSPQQSGAGHTWWISTAPIDPVQFTQDYLGETSQSENAAGWSPAKVPASAESSAPEVRNASSYWYRKSFMAPVSIEGDLMISLGEISDRDETYVNGVLVGKTGEWNSKFPQAYDRSRLYRIPRSVIREGNVNLILVRIQGYFLDASGIIQGQTSIGSAGTMTRHQYRVSARTELMSDGNGSV